MSIVYNDHHVSILEFGARSYRFTTRIRGVIHHNRAREMNDVGELARADVMRDTPSYINLSRMVV